MKEITSNFLTHELHEDHSKSQFSVLSWSWDYAGDNRFKAFINGQLIFDITMARVYHHNVDYFPAGGPAYTSSTPKTIETYPDDPFLNPSLNTNFTSYLRAGGSTIAPRSYHSIPYLSLFNERFCVTTAWSEYLLFPEKLDSAEFLKVASYINNEYDSYLAPQSTYAGL